VRYLPEARAIDQHLPFTWRTRSPSCSDARPLVFMGITILGSLRAGEKESVHPSIAALRAAIADDEVYMCRRAIFAGRHCLSNAILDAGDNPLGRFEFHTDEWAV
jgi:hypothetical protein